MNEIKFTCPSCRQSLEAAPDMAGEVIACPSCKKSIQIPGARTGASASRSANWKVAIWIGCASAALIVGFLVWFLAIRDTWERDNSVRIRELCDAVAGLAKDGKKSDTLTKYTELNELLGTRKMKNAYLADIVSQARTTGDDIRKEQEKQKNMGLLRAIESDAKRLENGSDWANASRKYGEALDFIEKNGTGDNDFRIAMERITQAKQSVDQRLAAIETEKARVAAEQKAREEMELQRKEEESRLARVRATVKGGAWLTKKAGNSEIIRGLNIFVLKAKASPESADRFLADAAEGSQERVKRAVDAENYWAKACRENPSNDYMRRDLDEKRSERESVVRLEAARTNLLASYRSTIKNAYFDIRKLYELLPERRAPSETAAWVAICAQQLQAKTATGIDGTYELQTVGGEFYLYAIYESDFSTVEWMIPIEVKEAGTQKIDFHNETAALIRNKKD